MNNEIRIELIERWLGVVYPSYLRYLSRLDPHRIWDERFPQAARATLRRVHTEQDVFCDNLAKILDSLGEEPDAPQFPENASRLNYLELSVAINFTLKRFATNIAVLQADRPAVADDTQMAELLEKGIDMLQRHSVVLKPLAAESTKTGPG